MHRPTEACESFAPRCNLRDGNDNQACTVFVLEYNSMLANSCVFSSFSLAVYYILYALSPGLERVKPFIPTALYRMEHSLDVVKVAVTYSFLIYVIAGLSRPPGQNVGEK